MPLLKAGPFSMFIGKSPSGWFSTRLEFAENHDTNAQLDNGLELSIKLDSVTARIGADSTTEYVIDPTTGEHVWAKETKLFGETLGHVPAETIAAVNTHKTEVERFKQNRKKPAIDVTAEPA
jgi:hypothetical protein